jgi:hypothetical protein
MNFIQDFHIGSPGARFYSLGAAPLLSFFILVTSDFSKEARLALPGHPRATVNSSQPKSGQASSDGRRSSPAVAASW